MAASQASRLLHPTYIAFPLHPHAWHAVCDLAGVAFGAAEPGPGVTIRIDLRLASPCNPRLAASMCMPLPLQNDFSLLDRRFEGHLAEACAPFNYNLGLLPYGPLAGGEGRTGLYCRKATLGHTSACLS